MTLVLELTEAQKERLQRYAAANGLTEEKALVRLVEALPAPNVTSGPRIAGLCKGWVEYVAPDFDDPLPDEFWLGDEDSDPLYRR